MDNTTRLLMMGAAGAANPTYVEDVFSTYLYTGNGSTQTITNGIDLAGKGGLVWIKGRSGATGHRFTDTARTATKSLASDSTAAEVTESTGLTSFSSTGFALGADADYSTNAATYASWTFRKAPKFFDVVTYTGNGSNRTIAHSLGSVPGCIIVKRTDTSGYPWYVYHRSLANTELLLLDGTYSTFTGQAVAWNSTTPTSTVFSLGTDAAVNGSGGTYVAYVFAHDAGGFGNSGNDSVVKCGSFSSPAGSATVTLDFEPQFILFKRSNGAENWYIADIMRGSSRTQLSLLYPNSSQAESSYSGEYLFPTATGFELKDLGLVGNYIYIAIRRGPMKTPTDATKVFNSTLITATQSTQNVTSVGFSPDMIINGVRSNANYGQQVTDRLRGVTKQVFTEYDSAENTTNGTALVSLDMAGFTLGSDSGGTGWNAYSGYTSVKWSFRRAPGFFDVVAYTGTGANRTVSHNLGVVPALMIVKKRIAADNWVVYAGDATDYLILNTTAATADLDTMWNDTAPTASVFSLGTNDDVNGNTFTYIAYLFATAPGVSKVFNFTGTGTTLQIDCGFTNGARLVLIKRTDSTGDWYIWDSARGIISGNDPYLLLNSAAAEVTNTDYIDPYSAGFEISSTAPAAINANGGSYIGLAIA